MKAAQKATCDRKSSAMPMEPGPAAGIAISSDAGSERRDDDYRYPGGKGLAGVYQWIIGEFPAHAYYAEPFAGLGSIFRRKSPALRSYLVDCDPRVVAWWNRRRDAAAIVHCGDGIRWLELAAEWAGHETMIYCDPPYLLSTRTKKRLYSRELSSIDHRRILRACRRCRCHVAISGYPSRMYSQELRDWQCLDREVITRGGVMRTECLWLNYSLQDTSPDMTVEYSALGGNFRERERVNRKIKRWASRIRGLPRHERRALLLSLINADRRARG
jgi:DNA adenine methylase